MKWLAMPLLMLSSWAVAYDFQPTEAINQVASAAIPGYGMPGVDVDAAVDPALRMPLCPEALEAQLQTGGTVEVTCPGGTGWRLFVPVKVRRLQPVLVLQRSMMAGELLTADVVKVETRDVERSVGALTNIEPITGFSFKRALAAGNVITASDVISPRLVRRGDTVTMVARVGGIEVRAQGRAMADGGAGDRVSVENQASRRTMQGRILQSGEIEVGR